MNPIKNKKTIAAIRLLVLLCAALAVGSLSGCAKGTYLEVRFTGTGFPALRGINVDLTWIQLDGGTFHTGTNLVPDAGTMPVRLPASMAFELADESGSLKVDATAVGLMGQPLATASKTTSIMHAKTWTAVVDFGTATGAAANQGDGTDGGI